MIKATLKSRIENAKLESSLKLFQLLTPNPELVNDTSLQLGRLNQAKKDFNHNLIKKEDYDTHVSIIGSNLLREIDFLPEDIDVLKAKLDTILHNYSIITDTIELLRYLTQDPNINYQLEKTSQDLSLSQENIDVPGKDDWKDQDDFLKKRLSHIIEGIDVWQLHENWPEKFIYWLENSNNSYCSIENYTTDTQVLSGYYSVVKSITKGSENFEIKGVLFNWLEHYLVGDFDSAYEILIKTRNDKGIGNAQFYEFLAASYSNISQFDKNVRDILIKGEAREFKRIVFYLERMKDTAKSPEILERTGRYICNRVIKVISKVYLNIAHNYFEDGLPRGRSKKRDVIKRCIDCFCQLREIFDNSDDLDVIYMLLMELDGVSKFPWIDIRSNTPTNTTTYDAIARRMQLLEMILDEGEYCDKLVSELEIKISELQKESSFQENIARRILNFCRIAYLNYRDRRFLDFIEIIIRGKKVIVQKDRLDSSSSELKEGKEELDRFLLEVGIATYFVSERILSDVTAGLGLLEEVMSEETPKEILTRSFDSEDSYFHFLDKNSSTKHSEISELKYYSSSLKQFPVKTNEVKNHRDYPSKVIMLIFIVLYLLVLLRAYDLNYVSPLVAILGVLIVGTGCVVVSIAANE